MIAWILAPGLLAGAVHTGRWWVARQRTHRRRIELQSALPDVVDLVLVILSAGGTIAEAVRLVAEQGPLAARSAFANGVGLSAAGVPLARALSAISESTSSAYRPIIAALVSSERDGAPIADLLLRLGDEARAARRQLAERRARTLPVQLVVPLVCCSLPAVLAGAVVPLALVALGRIRF